VRLEFPLDIVVTPVVLKHLGRLGPRHGCFGNLRRGRRRRSLRAPVTVPFGLAGAWGCASIPDGLLILYLHRGHLVP
jgi:hypothetical protein